jgi:hypothetical protein
MTDVTSGVHLGGDTEKRTKALGGWRGPVGLSYSYLRADGATKVEDAFSDRGSTEREHRVLYMGFRCFVLSQSLIRAVKGLSFSKEERNVYGSATGIRSRDIDGS